MSSPLVALLEALLFELELELEREREREDFLAALFFERDFEVAFFDALEAFDAVFFALLFAFDFVALPAFDVFDLARDFVLDFEPLDLPRVLLAFFSAIGGTPPIG